MSSRNARLISPPRLAFLAWGDFQERFRFACSLWGLLVVYPTGSPTSDRYFSALFPGPFQCEIKMAATKSWTVHVLENLSCWIHLFLRVWFNQQGNILLLKVRKLLICYFYVQLSKFSTWWLFVTRGPSEMLSDLQNQQRQTMWDSEPRARNG